MLLVQTYLDISSGKGLGLFAKVNISKGTQYWIRNEVFDKIIHPEVLITLGKLSIDYIKQYGCLEKSGNWYLCGDNARFSNHSETPNSKNSFNEFGLVQAHFFTRDISAGEEIFCDYRELCQTCINGVNF